MPAGSTRPADSEFDVQQAYKTGATLNDDFWHFRPVNLGVPYMYGTNSAGGYFEDLSSDQTYNIEDDAIIFVYNYMTNEYNVVKVLTWRTTTKPGRSVGPSPALLRRFSATLPSIWVMSLWQTILMK